MAVARLAAGALVLAACTEAATIVVPVFDLPTNSTAAPFPLDTITVSIAHAGSTTALQSNTFDRGDRLVLDNVPFGDNLVIELRGLVGAQLKASGKTCPFAVRADGRVPTPHLYLSQMRQMGVLTPRPLARENGTALTFADGSAIVLGGNVPGDTSQSMVQVERFDPQAGEYETLHDVAPRSGAAIALLGTPGNADIVVVGGLEAGNRPAQFIEMLDPMVATDEQYRMFPESQIAGFGLTATEMPDGTVLTIGGMVPGVGPSEEVHEIHNRTGTPEVTLLPHAKLAQPRYHHAATRLGDEVGAPVLVTGGLDRDGRPIAQAELFKPISRQFSTTFNATMIVPRTHHLALRLTDGSVLILGGLDAAGNAVAKQEVFSLESGFRDLGDVRDEVGILGVAATRLADGRILLTGGRRTPGGPALTYSGFAAVNPTSGDPVISATAPSSFPRAGHQSAILCDGTVLISGGTADQSPIERYNPYDPLSVR